MFLRERTQLSTDNKAVSLLEVPKTNWFLSAKLTKRTPIRGTWGLETRVPRLRADQARPSRLVGPALRANGTVSLPRHQEETLFFVGTNSRIY